MINIGIIGFGFLGTALAHGFAQSAEIKIYDKYQESLNTLDESVNESEIIFIGVPTPMNADGSQDLSNIDDAITNVVNIANERKIIVLRSTIIPGTTRFYANKHSDHIFIFMPEFLTERTAKLDFINPARFIYGTEEKTSMQDIDPLFCLFGHRFPHVPIYIVSWEAAEVAKYMANCFFAVKVSFMNEMYDVAEKIGVPYNLLKNMLLSDMRISNSHCDVPGQDGNRGYGGKCFPKDINAFTKWCGENDVESTMCEAANIVNNRIRPIKDWENIKGATTQNNYKKTKR